MYFIDALRVLRRRWLVVLIGLLCTSAAAVGLIRAVPTEYQASGQLLLLLPPTSTGRDTPTNPYLNLPSELTTTASLLAGTLMTVDSHEAVEDSGYLAEYDVAVIPGAGPLILVTTKDTDPAQTIATRDEVMRRIEAELAEIQDEVDVPTRQLITTRAASVSTTPEALSGSKVRALAGAGGVGGTLTLAAAFLVDRRKRRSAATEERPSGGTSG